MGFEFIKWIKFMCFPPLHAVERKVGLVTQQETGTSDGYCIFPKSRWLLTALSPFYLKRIVK